MYRGDTIYIWILLFLLYVSIKSLSFVLFAVYKLFLFFEKKYLNHVLRVFCQFEHRHDSKKKEQKQHSMFQKKNICSPLENSSIVSHSKEEHTHKKEANKSEISLSCSF